MNPWWKRPSSESSSTASREADKRSRPRRSDSDDDGNSGGGSRRRRGRRGGRGRSQDSGNRGRKESGGNNNRRGRNRGPRRGRRGRKGQDKTTQVALLVDVDALHKSLKAAGRPPEDATALLAGVGNDVARRAIASGSRKHKAQRALSDLGFDIEQVNGGAGAARLRLALDAVELALANRGAQLYLLADAIEQDAKGRRSSELKLLSDRLRDHGAEVTFFSIDEPLVIGDAKSDAADADQQDEAAGAQEQSADDQGGRSADSDGSDSSRRRRRRRGRRGRGGDDQEAAAGASSDSPEAQEEPAQPARKSTSEPLSLLTAAIGKLVEGESQLVWATKVRQEMSSIDPLFNELDHGYDDFEALLREAERRGRIALQKDPRTSTFVIVGWRAA